MADQLHQILAINRRVVEATIPTEPMRHVAAAAHVAELAHLTGLTQHRGAMLECSHHRIGVEIIKFIVEYVKAELSYPLLAALECVRRLNTTVGLDDDHADRLSADIIRAHRVAEE